MTPEVFGFYNVAFYNTYNKAAQKEKGRLMTASKIQAQAPMTGTQRKSGYPLAGRRFDLLASALAAWVLIGIFIDVHAHNHGQVDNTFFTPWHFLLYSGVLANGVMLGIAQYRNVGQGFAWTRSLPKGYLLSQIGVLIFAVGGAFDFVWHSLFGFEVNLEALLSPSHLLLALGGTLFLVGPLRSLWGREDTDSGWARLFPGIFSAALVMSVLTLFTEFANIVNQMDSFAGRGPSGNSFYVDSTLIAAVLIPAVILSGTLLLLLRRWQLPRGTVTFILTANALLQFYLRSGYIGDYWPALLAAPVAGIIGDLIIARWKPSVGRVTALRFFAFVVPLSYFLGFFVMLQLIGGIWWTIHLWLGACFMAGIVGLGLSYLLAPPAIPAKSD